MGLVKGLIKGAAIAAVSAACPAAAGPLLLANVASKVGKAISDDNNENAGKHVVSVLGSFAGASLDIETDAD